MFVSTCLISLFLYPSQSVPFVSIYISPSYYYNSPLFLCLPFSHSDTSVFPYRKGAPPPLPPRMSKSSLSVRAQSSTESTQDAYFQNSGQLASGPGRPKQHSNSVDLGGSEGPSGRSSRGGYYTAVGPGRSRQYSNSAESLDGVRGSRELVPYGGGPGVGVRPKHSSSADSLLEGPMRPSRERDGRVGGSLGKSASLPQNSMALSKTGGHDDVRGGRKLRPSIAVQVRKDINISQCALLLSYLCNKYLFVCLFCRLTAQKLYQILMLRAKLWQRSILSESKWKMTNGK